VRARLLTIFEKNQFSKVTQMSETKEEKIETISAVGILVFSLLNFRGMR